MSENIALLPAYFVLCNNLGTVEWWSLAKRTDCCSVDMVATYQVILVLADIKQLDRLRASPVKTIRLVILVLVDGGKSLRIALSKWLWKCFLMAKIQSRGPLIRGRTS